MTAALAVGLLLMRSVLSSVNYGGDFACPLSERVQRKFKKVQSQWLGRNCKNDNRNGALDFLV